MKSWKANWIWYESEPKANTYGYFKKILNVTDTKNCTAHITADTRYRLYINGNFVATGPIQSQCYLTYYDTVDLSPYVSEGENVVLIVGYYGGHLTNTKGAILAEILGGNGEILAKTDENFLAMRAESWDSASYGIPYINRYAPYQEFFDAGKTPSDLHSLTSSESWHGPAVHKKGNSAKVPTVAPWSFITERPIPFMANKELPIAEIVTKEECQFLVNRFRKEDLSISLSQAGSPLLHTKIEGDEEFMRSGSMSGENVITVTGCADKEFLGEYNPTLLLDFGRVVTAHFFLEIEAKKGQFVEIGYAERLVNGHFNNALECPFADMYMAKDGTQSFKSFNWRGFRYVKLVFKKCFAPMKITKIGAVESSYPFEEKGSFASNNEKLNAVFNISRETLKLCCNESIVDTPFREQSQWVGDVSAVTLGGIYSCFGETKLAKKYLIQSARNQSQDGSIPNMTNIYPDGYHNSMVDYNMWWVISVWDYYMHTGEEGIIHELYPTVAKMIMNLFNYIDDDGMLSDLPYVLFLDWTAHDRRGQSSILNAIFYGMLKSAEKMASYKNDEYLKAKIVNTANKIKENFNSRFYCEEQKLYVDCNVDGEKSSCISESANVLPFYFDLCTKERATDLIKRIYKEKAVQDIVIANPFMCFFALLTMAKSDNFDTAVKVIEERWYGYMVARGAKSTFEEWSENGSYRNGDFLPIFRTHSHAWSAGPAEFLIKTLAGVELLSPCGKEVRVNPIVTDFDYNITIPLKNGEVNVAKKEEKVVVTKTGDIKIC